MPLSEPHGGALVDLCVGAARAEALREQSRDWPSWDLTPSQLGDLDLLTTGGYSPLEGFMSEAECDSVRRRMRLPSGVLWPWPVTLAIDARLAAGLARGSALALRDAEGVMLAALHVADVWTSPDGTTDLASVGGRVEALRRPLAHDFTRLRRTPREWRAAWVREGDAAVMAVEPVLPLSNAQLESVRRAAASARARVWLQSVMAMGPLDNGHYARLRCLEAVAAHGLPASTVVGVLPLPERPPGAAGLIARAIIARNFGCQHAVLGPVGGDEALDAEAARDARAYEGELGVSLVAIEPPDGAHWPAAAVRRRLALGHALPDGYAEAPIAEALGALYPPHRRQGFTVFFTGLSGSGKSTIANELRVRLLEQGGRPVTLLDGDLVRKHLSSELGFSREHRDINIRRIGFVAAEITKNGGAAICAPIAPYRSVRREVRAMVERVGGFVLVHVATPLEVCERRDRKGLYAKARSGAIPQFTGISDPYEEPADAEVVIEAERSTPAEAADQIVRYLQREGFVPERF